MPIIPWNCAHGDAPWASLLCQSTLELGAADSNRVVVTGRGTITSLGPPPADAAGRGVPCTKTVYFEPDGPIIIEPSDHIALLGSGSRVIEARSFAVFCCDGYGHWSENSFTSLDWSPTDMDELIDIVLTSTRELNARERFALRERILLLMARRMGIRPASEKAVG